MSKQKLCISQLEVKSFITKDKQDSTMGGNPLESLPVTCETSPIICNIITPLCETFQIGGGC